MDLIVSDSTALYGPEIHSLALRLMFRDMNRGQVDGPARALVALPLEEIQAFFAGMSIDERSQWYVTCIELRDDAS